MYIIINRELYIKKIRPFIDKNIVKVLTGIRRCGKSTLLELVKKELIIRGVSLNQIISINFESGRYSSITDEETLYSYVKNQIGEEDKKIYLFFDEIQEVEGWEKAINSFMVDFNVDIYITGSNAKMLSGELATYLGGRYIEIKIYPFSFKEIIEIYKSKNIEISKESAFRNYLIFGGMPFIFNFDLNLDKEACFQYLNDIYDSIILKDIVQRNKIRDVELLKRVILYVMANIGNTFSAQNITKFLKNEKRSVSQETIYNYIDYFKTACLIHLVQREDVVGKKVLNFQEKMYLTDHGMREAIYGNNQRDINQILENIIYMELLRRDYKINVGKIGTKEVDFVAKKGSEKIYVQVSYLLASQETIEREFSVLEKIPDNYPKYVVTMDEFNMSRNGIKHMNIRDFLLKDEYN